MEQRTCCNHGARRIQSRQIHLATHKRVYEGTTHRVFRL